ncbi:MAG: 50S ribosomal protein L25 [Candidatus Omnitrophica bacterium]|nr:50S ribosomal protein L25 [Candidatus Omnitrophota bacterium]
MEEIKLKAKIREEIGKEAVKKLRVQGHIPAVVYKGKKSQNIKFFAKDFLEAIHTKAGENVIIDLEVEASASGKSGKSKKSRPTIIKEVQYHPVKGDILHVDLNEISLTEAITVKVPIAVKGEPDCVGVKEGGVLEHVIWEVEVECLPTQIPESIVVEVQGLKIGDGIMLKDLKVPVEIKLIGDPEQPVIHVAAPHVEEEAEVSAEGEGVQEPEVIREKKVEEEDTAEGPPAKEGKESDKGKKA